MFERFTEKAIKVVMISQEESRRLGHNFVGTEQMLLGLIGEGTGIAARALKQEGLTLRDLRAEVERIIGRGTGFVAVEIPFTPRAKCVLEESLEIARDFGHGYVATEHLLLALLAQEDGVAWQIFKHLEIDCDAIRHEVLLYLGIDTESAFSPKSLPTPAGGKFPNNNRDYSLEDYTTNLTKQARENLLDPVIGREKEIARVIQILVRRKKNNPVLIGEPGVGKTAVAEGLALRITSKDVPSILANKELISLDIGLLLAGTKYRGEFEERIKRIMDEVQSNRDLILVIDEVHTVIGAGAAEGAMDAANILKPALARGELQCLGATTIEEYRKNIEKDPALERRFQPVTVPEPSIEDTILILKGLREAYELHHKVEISDEAVTAAAKLGAQFIADRFLPDKAIDLIDEACARVRISMASLPTNVRELEEEIKALANLKAMALAQQDFVAASNISLNEQTARAQLKLALSSQRIDETKNYSSTIGYDDVAIIVSEWTGIPVTKVSKDETDKLVKMEEILHQRVIGQHEAVTAVSSAIRRARVGLKNPNRPIASFIFSGPTGVGKTELTKALAGYFFGSEDSMVRLDMSEYMERHHVAKLIGSPPGYVGFSEGGYLTEEVRRKPYTLLLFDEVEKAHPDVFNLLLQILEDGRLTDSQGRLINFKNTLVILTSNIGAKSIEKSDDGLGFDASEDEVREAHQRVSDLVHDELKQFFRPEFLNRIDEIIVFQPLTRKDIKQIADIMLKEIVARVKEQGLDLEITESARDKLAMDGFNPTYGARPLRRTIMSSLEDKLASLMLTASSEDGTSYLVDVESDQIRVTRKKELSPESSDNADGVNSRRSGSARQKNKSRNSKQDQLLIES
uniref:Putative regulatory subunit of ATP-dependent Clp protease n=1 Tax=Rhizochromulina marina TaxID=1034831 RepID=A0A514CQ50_9STRA|nr:putative regulatory subunit of ATP-dependent Clp protease [Rhizochromulina marina]QDH81904.1 putative regulatory subunit of ATP-dependent Clp protease [Rhizochromulina marina]